MVAVQDHLLSLEDSDLRKHRWYTDKHGYTRRKSCGTTIYMHREVAARMFGLAVFAAGRVVDHINGVRSDNRRENLRLTTIAGNCQNLTKLTRANASGYRGVGWNKNAGKWAAYVRFQGRSHHLGLFTDPAAAARVAAAKRTELGFLTGASA